MKKVKIITSAFAFAFALIAAIASNVSAESEAFNVPVSRVNDCPNDVGTCTNTGGDDCAHPLGGEELRISSSCSSTPTGDFSF